jgi:hypothetical protein
MENKDELIKYGKCWKKLKKSLEELIEYNKQNNKETEKYEIMLMFMKVEEDEIGEKKLKNEDYIINELKKWIKEQIEKYLNHLIMIHTSSTTNEINYFNNKIETYEEILKKIEKLKENKNGSY